MKKRRLHHQDHSEGRALINNPAVSNGNIFHDFYKNIKTSDSYSKQLNEFYEYDESNYEELTTISECSRNYKTKFDQSHKYLSIPTKSQTLINILISTHACDDQEEVTLEPKQRIQQQFQQ